MRAAHQSLANRYRDWPRFGAPSERAALTIGDLDLVSAPAEYVEVLQRWARAIWVSWRDEHARVINLARGRLGKV